MEFPYGLPGDNLNAKTFVSGTWTPGGGCSRVIELRQHYAESTKAKMEKGQMQFCTAGHLIFAGIMMHTQLYEKYRASLVKLANEWTSEHLGRQFFAPGSSIPHVNDSLANYLMGYPLSLKTGKTFTFADLPNLLRRWMRRTERDLGLRPPLKKRLRRVTKQMIDEAMEHANRKFEGERRVRQVEVEVIEEKEVIEVSVPR